jgi:hypothetical protein
MKKLKEKKTNVENLIGDSLRFHGLLTPSNDPKNDLDISLPDHLKEPDFLFKKKSNEKEFSKIRMAAFKNNKTKRGK